ncbi:TPA: DUF2790 domain-containing protein [Pseudomonas aeruginosa]|uniref:DUF2790 domain-containing protein n=1 Tax=Pseudomonas tohonis TaxID=2725477 RepID=A0A6J4E518_9PSED|nr:DUF2790 domain-containing protein [Pseudomonas tohonis]BCG24967.1 hypothetical protein TUM18999_31580 [Pseudomonas tohonis]GJN53792.1 hypothetical protein TUM20286_35440 [Pseudomonas tohonis]
MKLAKLIVLVVALASTPYTFAINTGNSTSAEIEAQFERANLKETTSYAALVKQPIPEIKDYKYGMKLDVAKVIYRSPSVKYCGTVKKLLSYADSQGNLHAIRYLAQGECQNQR